MKTILITGATSGIGHATAREFARRGCRLVIAARSASALEEVARELEREGAEVLAVPTDVARWEDVERLARAAADRFGRIDVWVNNAAVAEWAFVEDMAPEDMRRVIEVDILGPMFGARAVLPYMRRQNAGVIINVASALAERAIPLLSTYSAAKAAVKSFSDSLRMELKASGAAIAVVTILPSAINTPFYRWGQSKLGVRPHPVSVIYPPSAVARAIVAAADRPQREIFVGFVGKAISIGERISPRALDWYMLRRHNMLQQQYTSQRDAGESNLHATPGETDIDGAYSEQTRRTSIYTSVVELRPGVRRALAAGLVLGLLGGAFAFRRRRGLHKSRTTRAGGR